jgi:hypothetical protein
MRTHLVILILILTCLFPISLFAEDVLLGTVLSVEKAKGEIVLDLPDNPWGDEGPESKGRSVLVHMAPENIPDNLETGIVIRVWGNYMNGPPRIFQADTVRGRWMKPGMPKPPPGAMVDPTGVRSRLGRDMKGPGAPPPPRPR